MELTVYFTGSVDPEFDDCQRNFGALETATDKIIKDSKVFIEAVISASCFCTDSLVIFSDRLKCALFLLLDALLTIRVPQDLFTAGSGVATHFSALFHPIAGEFDLIGKNPDAAFSIRNVDAYHDMQEELRSLIAPELELIESRIIGPVKELRDVLKSIRKSITKRDHKVHLASFIEYMYLF